MLINTISKSNLLLGKRTIQGLSWNWRRVFASQRLTTCFCNSSFICFYGVFSVFPLLLSAHLSPAPLLLYLAPCLLSLSLLSACSLLPSWLPYTLRGPCLCHSLAIPVTICLCWPVPSFSFMSLCHSCLLHSAPCLLHLFPFAAQCLGLIISHCSFYFEELSIYVLRGLPISCS